MSHYNPLDSIGFYHVLAGTPIAMHLVNRNEKLNMKTQNNRNTRAAKMFKGIVKDRERLALLESEHAALCAVAEIAPLLAKSLRFNALDESGFLSDDDSDLVSNADKLFASLAEIRTGKDGK